MYMYIVIYLYYEIVAILGNIMGRCNIGEPTEI